MDCRVGGLRLEGFKIGDQYGKVGDGLVLKVTHAKDDVRFGRWAVNVFVRRWTSRVLDSKNFQMEGTLIILG